MTMLSPEELQELRKLQERFKDYLPTAAHQVRELPGSQRKWVFLPWQAIRERLDEVAPDWMSDFSNIQYSEKDAICKCGITIMGVRKEAIASVPISLISSKGNDMARGSAADRLAAEALKNAAEHWGIGRYLDDQVGTIRHLWEHRAQLTTEMEGEIRKLMGQYSKEISTYTTPKAKEAGGMLEATAGVSTVKTINDAQVKRLWAIARKELNLSDSDVKSVLAEFNVESTASIPASEYDKVIQRLRDFATKF